MLFAVIIIVDEVVCTSCNEAEETSFTDLSGLGSANLLQERKKIP